MSIELTNEQRRQVLENRLAQFAFDKYGHVLNKQIALQNNDQEAVVAADNAIAVIDLAADVYKVELDSIPVIIEVEETVITATTDEVLSVQNETSDSVISGNTDVSSSGDLYGN